MKEVEGGPSGQMIRQAVMVMFVPWVIVVEKTKVGLARAVLMVQMVMRMVVVERGERGCCGTAMARYLKLRIWS